MAATPSVFVEVHTGSASSLGSGSLGTTALTDALIFTVSDGGNGTPSGSDSNTNPNWAQVGTSQTGTTGVRGSFFGCPNISTAGAGHSVTVSYGSNNNINLVAGFVSLTCGAGSIDTPSLVQGTDNSSPYQITSNAPTQSDNLWLSLYVPPDAGLGTETFTPPTNWSIVGDITDRNTSYCHALGGRQLVDAGAQSITWADTSTTDDRLIWIVAIKSLVASAPVVAPKVKPMFMKGGPKRATFVPLKKIPSVITAVFVTADVAETSAGTDAVDRTLALSASIAETSAGTDAVDRTVALSAAIAESSAGTDAVDRTIAISEAVAESSAGTEAVDRTLAVPAALAESSVGTDTVDRTLDTITRDLAETSAGTDVVDRVVTLPGTYDVAETSAGTDTVNRTIDVPASLAELSAGTDAIDRTLGTISRDISESSAGTDQVDRTAVTPDQAVTETSAGTDAVDRTIGVPAAVTEATSGTDAVDRALSLPGAVAESSAGTDAVDRTVTVSRAIDESSAGTDEVTSAAASNDISETSVGDAAVDRTVVIPSGVYQLDESAQGSDRLTVTSDPLPGLGSSGLRRWLIQYYSDYFAKREKVKAIEALATAVVEEVSAGVIPEKKIIPVQKREIVVSTPSPVEVRERLRRVAAQKQVNEINRAIKQAQDVLHDFTDKVEKASIADANRKRSESEQDDEDLLLLAAIL